MSIAIQDAAVWKNKTHSLGGNWVLSGTAITITASLADSDWKIADGRIQLRAMEGLSDAKRWAEIYAREHGLL